MNEKKAVVQEIWKTSVLYPKTSKEFYHHIKFRKSIINRKCSARKLFLKISQYIEKFLRKPILKNICKRLLLRVFLERFPTWANNIRSEEDVFSKRKQKKTVLKLSYIKKIAISCSLLYHLSLFLHCMSDGVCPS